MIPKPVIYHPCNPPKLVKPMTKKIYLCGPITHADAAEKHQWRDYIKAKCPQGYECLDPTRKPYTGDAEAIIKADLADIAASEIVLRFCEQLSDGSSMEQYAAFIGGKHVIVVIPNGTLVSPWVRHFSHEQVATLEEAIDAINALPRW